MASPIVKGNNFGATDTVTNTTLNNIVDNSTFKGTNGNGVAFSVSGSDLGTCVSAGGLAVHTTGQLQLKSQANLTALGNTSGSSAVPTAVAILDEDNMSSDSATSLATQQSIKKYVDDSSGLKASTATGTISGTTSYTELDLSSVVGSNKAMVIMEVYNANTIRTFHFKTNGSPQNYTSISASSVAVSTSNVGGTVVVTTDSAGKLQHRANLTSSGTTYVVQAFQVIS
tara:strand:+ start:873 stop:1556 length:684 start_codon:yes stop_codon:yes gene_type:complete